MVTDKSSSYQLHARFGRMGSVDRLAGKVREIVDSTFAVKWLLFKPYHLCAVGMPICPSIRMITEGGIMSRWKLEREPAAPSLEPFLSAPKIHENHL